MKYKLSLSIEADLIDELERRGIPKSLFIETAIKDALDGLKDNLPKETGEEEPVEKPVETPAVKGEKAMIASIIKDIGYTPEMFRIQGNRFNKGQEDAIALEMRKRYSRMVGTELIYQLLPDEFKGL